jgi:hypothetical protein
MSKLRTNVLSSSPGEGGVCISESNHDRRTVTEPNLFVSKRRLQELRSQTQNLSWFHDRRTAPRSKLFVSAKRLQELRSQTQNLSWFHDRRMAPRSKLFVSARRLQELRSQTQNLSWFRFPVKILGRDNSFPVIFYDKYRMIRLWKAFGQSRLIIIVSICRISPQ